MEEIVHKTKNIIAFLLVETIKKRILIVLKIKKLIFGWKLFYITANNNLLIGTDDIISDRFMLHFYIFQKGYIVSKNEQEVTSNKYIA